MSQQSPGRGAHRAAGGGSGFHRWFTGLGERQRIGLLAGTVVVIALVGVLLAAVLSGGSPKGADNPPATDATTTTTTPPPPPVAPTTCPLTGLPAPGGKVPQRVALAVKIGNDPSSRPQSGLDEADIVYEEMAEGGITRYMAVFQCTSAPLLGPIRSVRWDDWNILRQYGHAILAYSGGIQPWMTIAGSLPWIYDANGSLYPTSNAFYRYNSSTLPASQGAPYNYYSSTAALWALFKHAKTPPPTLFAFSKAVPAGATPASSASIPFSGASPVVWKWSASRRQWLRFYDSQPDTDPGGHQFHATNVIIQIVKTRPGPYNESYGYSPDVESITTGTGTVYVLRNGVVEKGIWSRPGGADITKFTFPNGKPITLQPGRSWFEVVPSYVTVSITK